MSAPLTAAARVRRPDDDPDGRLLDRFRHDADHAAFERLMRRHGGMVLGVCRRIARNPADADDAFQAVFLVLARKAGELAGRATVGNWLYGVAVHTARKANAMAARRRLKEAAAARPTPPADDPDWRPVFDQALAALPDKYREPLVLHELDGLTRKEVAGQLGIPEGTLSSRLATAKRMLADRLTRLGLPAVGVSAAVVPPALLANTMRAVGGAATATATTLAREVATMMLVNGLRTKVGVGLAVLAAAVGGLAAVPRTAADEPAKPASERVVGEDYRKVLKAEEDAAAALRGTWARRAVAVNGKPAVTEGEFTMSFADRTVTTRQVVPDRAKPEVREASFTVNPRGVPAELNVFGDGLLLLGVYRLDGDELTFATFGRSEVARPKGFDPVPVKDGGPLSVSLFRRKKPAADEKQAAVDRGLEFVRKQPVEPAWKADFRKEYGLADGQVVKVLPIALPAGSAARAGGTRGGEPGFGHPRPAARAGVQPRPVRG